MYIPKAFEVTDNAALFEVIRSNPLGVLFSHAAESHGAFGLFKTGKTGLSPENTCATHVPFVLVTNEDGSQQLLTHLAAQNHHVDLLAKEENCLVVFQGPQSYISPSWYPTKKKNQKAVPTWDYTAVHVFGKAKLIKGDREWLLNMLNLITDQQEGKRPEGPEFEEKWRVSDAPTSYVDGMLANIVGVEIEIEKMEGNFKLHQNYPSVNVNGIIHNLETEVGGDKGTEMADYVRNHYPNQL